MTDAADDKPGVIARPPLIFLALLIVGGVLETLMPAGFGVAEGWRPVGWAMIAVGLGVIAACAVRFRRAGTNVQTSRPSTRLVVGGLYRFSRNPIYVGFMITFLGIGVVADSAWLLGLALVLFVILRIGVIAREEAYLEHKFGDDYRAYKARVRRWL